ncbi:MAG: hypothetical protein Q8Q82_13840 [Hydrogenophaga sp.]|nr:hypothetical protein [Hydrogenophaga sp.]
MWAYADQTEACYAVEMHASAGFDLPSIDAFLEDSRLPADIRDHLLETRQESLHDYANGRFELAVSKFETLHARSLYYGQNLAVAPEVRLVEAFKERQRQNASGGKRLSEQEEARLYARFRERCDNGEKYGAQKELSAQYGIPLSTVKNVIARQSKNQLAKNRAPS